MQTTEVQKKKLLIIEDDEDKPVIPKKKILIIEDDDKHVVPKKKVLTEDLGKMFEMGICLLYGIDYDGTYSYSMDEAHKLKDRVNKLKEVFPYNIKHVAKNGNQYDFESAEDKTINLSAKTTKKDGKVCPQVIGQPSKKKFCEHFGVDSSYDLEQIKNFIKDNVTNLLERYCSTTFDCPIIYYNKHKNLLLFVKLKEHIDWTKQEIVFKHIRDNKKWNESTTIYINNISIGEFQVHNHRDCIKFRWVFEKMLDVFKHNFDVVNLSA